MSAVPTSSVDNENPWPGLEPFTELQSAFFFGRGEEARELSRRLERKVLTVLFGQSGLGKSSLLQAGVFPGLRASDYCPIYVRLDYNPLAAPPVEQVKTAVLRGTSNAGTWTHPGVAAEGETLWEFFHHRDDVLRGPGGEGLTPVLVFDQFEEVFTVGAASEDTRLRARAFLTELADLIENRPPSGFEAKLDAGKADPEAFDFTRSDYRVLIALREDYLPNLESLKGPIPSLMQNRMRLTRMTGTQALEAVTKPAGGRVSDDVARAIVAFVAGRSDLASAEVEPALLSLVCRELNIRRQAVGAQTIEATLLEGSRDTILTEFYERALADLPPAVRNFVEDDLVTETGFRENLALERAQKKLTSAGADPKALDTLVARRLLRYEERLDLRRIELTHDVLCGVVKSSRALRQAREAQAAEERRLRETESELARARSEEAAALRQASRARFVAAGCAILALLAIAAAVFGYLNLRRARAAEAEALDSRRVAQSSRDRSERLVNYLLQDLRRDLEQIGRLNLLENLAQQSLAYYDAVPAAGRDAATARNHALAFARLADIQALKGEVAEAADSIQKAFSQLESGGKGDRNSDAYALARGQILTAQARLHRVETQMPKAFASAQEAVRLLRPLADRPDASAEVLSVAADAASYLGYVGFYILSSPEYQDSLTEGSALLERARHLDPFLTGVDQRIGENFAWAAAGLERLSLFAQAETMAERAIKILEAVKSADPTNKSVLRLLGTAQGALSLSASESGGKLDDSLSLNEKSIANLAEILAVDPSNEKSLNNRQVAESRKGSILIRQGRVAECESTFAFGRSLLDRLVDNTLKSNLASALGRLAEVQLSEGKAEAAAENVARLRQIDDSMVESMGSDSVAAAVRNSTQDSQVREVALAAIDVSDVLVSGQKDIAKLEAVRPANPAEVLQIGRALERTRIQAGLAAAQMGRWAEAETLLRRASDELMGHNGRGLLFYEFGIVQTYDDLVARVQSSLAWVYAHEDKATDAVALGEKAAVYFRQRKAAADPTDALTSLQTATAEIALARARISARGSAAEIRTGLAAADRLLTSLPAEYRVTNWVKKVEAQFAETKSLAP